jgi:hypothetical protein
MDFPCCFYRWRFWLIFWLGLFSNIIPIRYFLLEYLAVDSFYGCNLNNLFYLCVLDLYPERDIKTGVCQWMNDKY